MNRPMSIDYIAHPSVMSSVAVAVAVGACAPQLQLELGLSVKLNNRQIRKGHSFH
jgi:hypothetical protein